MGIASLRAKGSIEGKGKGKGKKVRSLYNWAQNPSFRIMYVIIRFFSTIIPITLDFLAIYEIIPFRTHKN